ncbi:MAG: metallophosphoesterase [Candidatus Latescibacteria bacterium]|nr:metallophosphoesterase [Candidatus Latescibacterota bacterium]
MNEIIGVISDTHDNIPNIECAVDIFNQYQVSLVIHCGDFIAPFALVAFKDLKCPLIGVFGNCDGEQDFLLHRAQELKYSIYHPPYTSEISDKKILISHKPVIPDNNFDIIIYGHTHKPQISIQKNQKPYLIINPGEASGWLFHKATIAIMDLKTITAQLIPL